MTRLATSRKLLGTIELTGTLTCLSGLHIGASKENIEIGALDSPVVRDPVTNEPYIPGSSLKGKLRALLEKTLLELPANRNGGTNRNPIRRHECDGWQPRGNQPGAVNCPVCRLFGSTTSGGGGPEARNYPARLTVRDLYLTDESRRVLEGLDTGLHMTEWKFENSIDRITSAANPRNLERVPRDAEFAFSLIYHVEDPATLKDDLLNLKLAVEILQVDSLGGHGSRGYGWVALRFDRMRAKTLEWFRTRDPAAQKETTPLDQLDDHAFDELIQWIGAAVPASAAPAAGGAADPSGSTDAGGAA